MWRKTLDSINMRISLLLHGNSRGVSSNWLSKKLTSIYGNNALFVESVSNSWNIELDDIYEGEASYDKMVSRFSNKIYGSSYDCESGLASFLHAYILRVRPKIIVETGVANGITTNVMMSALEQTGGVPHSFDIDRRCKNVYTGNGNWFFHHLSKPFPRSLKKNVTGINDIELWIHDSNHGYSWQRFEYELAFGKLSKGGILV